jgi:APA family basic amino acid/polyamine antiporter
MVLVIVLASLATVVSATVASHPGVGNLGDPFEGGVRGILQAGGLLFFAFAGYARIATLGEEVRDPRRTIPRAIPLALFIALAVYAVVAIAALLAVGAQDLASTPAPLSVVVEASPWSCAGLIVRSEAAAALGVLLSLLAGVVARPSRWPPSDLPHWLAAVDERRRVPHRVEITSARRATVLVDSGAPSGSARSQCSRTTPSPMSAWTCRRTETAARFSPDWSVRALAFSLP